MSLDSLIEQAARDGFQAVELRQGSLGEYEAAVADARLSAAARDRLEALSSRFPGIQFDLAISFPCFDASANAQDPRLLDAVAAAAALGRGTRPHLRIVDTQTRRPSLGEATVVHAAELVADLALAMASAGGDLSIEHAHQDWTEFLAAFRSARHALSATGATLLCCLDPCNLLFTQAAESVPATVATIDVRELSMIHLKQRRDGRIQPDVAFGDLDWQTLIDGFERRGYRGPWLFEVAPDPDVRENLRRSVQFL